MSTISNGTRRKASRKRSKVTGSKVNRRKITLSKYRKATDSTIQSENRKQDVKTDQNRVTKGREGACFYPWQKCLSVLFIIFNFCGLNFVWRTFHCYLRPRTGAAAVSDREEHSRMNEHRKHTSRQLAVGGLCVNRSSLLPLLSFLLVLVQILLMLCGDVEPNPGPTTLTMNELDQVVKVLQPIQHKWLELGCALLVPQQTLVVVSQQCSPENCLRVMLQVWMQSKDSVLTWETLSDAVVAVGEKDLSQSINHQYVVASNFSSQQGEVLFSSLLISLWPHFLIVRHVPYSFLLLSPLPSSLL